MRFKGIFANQQDTVDFIAKNQKGDYLEIQVKAICKTNYMFIKKNKIVLDDHHIVALLRLEDYEEPEMYVFPATVWKKTNRVFKDRSYGEWGFNYSKSSRNLIEKYLNDSKSSASCLYRVRLP